MALTSEEAERWKAEQARAWLMAVRSSYLRCDALRLEVERLRSLLLPQAVSYDGEAGACSEADKALVNGVQALTDAIESYVREIDELVSEQRRVDAVLRTLPDAQRAAVTMHYLSGLTWLQVGFRLDYSEKSAKRIAYQGLSAMWASMPHDRRSPMPPAI